MTDVHDLKRVDWMADMILVTASAPKGTCYLLLHRQLSPRSAHLDPLGDGVFPTVVRRLRRTVPSSFYYH